MSISNSTIGKSIAYLRQKAQMTQSQLSSVLNVSHQAVSKWETGLAVPDFVTMLRISRLFGITIEQLITGDIPGMEMSNEGDTIDKICDFAGIAAKAAQQFSATVVDSVSKAINSAGDFVSDIYSEITRDDDENETEDGTEAGEDEEFTADEVDEKYETMSLSSLIDLAPFMSKEKLTEEVMKCREVPTTEKMRALAPFISSDALEELLARNQESIDADTLARLAPYLKKDQLFSLIMQCPDAMTLQNLKRFAPWLKRGMVDTIVETINKAKTSVDTAELLKQAGNVTETIREKINDVVKSVTAEVKQDGEEPAAQVVNERIVISSELKDKVARAALNAKSWVWLNSHIDEIADEDLLFDIAAETASIDDCVQLFKNAAAQLDSESISRLVTILIENRDYEKLILIADCTSDTDADAVLVAASKDFNEEAAAKDAVKLFASQASSEMIEQLTHTAINENNWELIEMLTPAM